MEDELKGKREKRAVIMWTKGNWWVGIIDVSQKKNFNLRMTDSQQVDVWSHVVSAFHILNLQDELHRLVMLERKHNIF